MLLNIYILLRILTSLFYINFQFMNKQENVKKNYITLIDIMSIIIIFSVIILPVISYLYDNKYKENKMLSFIGIIIMIIVFIILYNIYKELGTNYSPSLQIKKDHKLIKTGIYKYIRHPMYLCGILILITNLLVFPNKISIICFIIGLIVFFLLRIPKEEEMLSTEFKEYIKYKENTKMIIPYIL